MYEVSYIHLLEKISKHLVYFDYQNLNSVCSRYHYVNICSFIQAGNALKFFCALTYLLVIALIW